MLLKKNDRPEKLAGSRFFLHQEAIYSTSGADGLTLISNIKTAPANWCAFYD